MNAPAPVQDITADLHDDARFMAATIEFGRRNLGLTAPNPSVGALVVRDGIIIGRGATRQGGRPHAETEALRDAGEAARGATLYVSLEPCSHHGVTPPCADAIVRAGIARVVSALDDPDSRVAGRGHARLIAAGIDVTVGIGAEAARRANLGHILRITTGRPMLTLKLAETADGFAAGGRHDARLMITGLAANNRVQMMRAQHDAIMVGVGTALADDPLLTVRAAGLDRYRPLRIVLDTNLRLPLRSRLATTARDRKTLVIAGHHAPAERQIALEGLGIEVVRGGAANGHVDLVEAMALLGSRGITRVFSEGGPTVAAELIRLSLADDVLLFTSPKPLARDGVPALAQSARALLGSADRYRMAEDVLSGVDRLRRYERKL